MSFSADTKNELARLMPEKKCCELAEIAGFLKSSGSIMLVGRGGMKIVLVTENPAVARHYKILLKDYFKIETELVIEDAPGPKKANVYKITIDPDNRSESILRETGVLLVREGNNYISDGIYQNLVKSKCCRKAYLRGIFLGAGSVNDPNNSYHLEIVCDSKALANDLKKLINTFEDLSAKIVERKGKFVCYMKNSQYISDTLAIMGAYSQVLKFEDVKIKKDILNKTTRIINCDAANTDRTLDASQRQVDAINKLKENGSFDTLSPKLKELAELRIEYPEASLVQLGEMMDPPLKKSGVNNRMKRIVEFAKNL